MHTLPTAPRYGLLAALFLAACSAPDRLAQRPAGPHLAVVEVATGIRMHYAEQGPEDGKPVVLLHGYADSWYSWSRVLPLLPADWRVYALDQRGHGRSDAGEGGYTMAALGADALAFMDAKGIDRATIVGHSMGSLVAQQIALAQPRRVSQLVLVGSARGIRSFSGWQDLAQAVAALTDPVPREFIEEFQRSTVFAPVPAEFMSRVVDESARLTSRTWQAAMRGMLATNPTVAVGRPGLPILVAWGEEDQVFQREAQTQLLAEAPGATFVAYPATGHAPHWERPQDFALDLIAFVDRRESPERQQGDDPRGP